MTTHFIVIPPGQREDAVLRRIAGYARQVGERFHVDRNMPSARVVVGSKTLERWHQTNRDRAEADRQAAAAADLARTAATAVDEAPEPAVAKPVVKKSSRKSSK